MRFERRTKNLRALLDRVTADGFDAFAQVGARHDRCLVARVPRAQRLTRADLASEWAILAETLPPKRANIAHSPTRAGDSGVANAPHGRLGFIEESLLRHPDDPPPGILEQFATLDVALPRVGIAVSSRPRTRSRFGGRGMRDRDAA